MDRLERRRRATENRAEDGRRSTRWDFRYEYAKGFIHGFIAAFSAIGVLAALMRYFQG